MTLITLNTPSILITTITLINLKNLLNLVSLLNLIKHYLGLYPFLSGDFKLLDALTGHTATHPHTYTHIHNS